MTQDESDVTIGRLFREHRDVADRRVRIAERVKQIADALRQLAMAIDRRPDFEAVSRDSILQQYLDLTKIGALVVEESELSTKQLDYEERLRKLGFNV